jgi:hypothetical protein
LEDCLHRRKYIAAKTIPNGPAQCFRHYIDFAKFHPAPPTVARDFSRGEKIFAA